MIIGILALQGDVEEHKKILKQLDVKHILVKCKNDMKDINGLIIPGGESSVLKSILLRDNELLEELKKFICKQKKPVFATCGGAILLCRTLITKAIANKGFIPSIDCEMIKNLHGSRINNFTESINIKTIGWYDCVFIRQPIINSIGNCKIWAHHCDSVIGDTPIMISNQNVLMCTFHPELINPKIHKLFINKFVKKENHNIEV
jgi:pyridoxal 5'-phosphate synthase pdxT subunit